MVEVFWMPIHQVPGMIPVGLEDDSCCVVIASRIDVFIVVNPSPLCYK